MPQSPAQAKLLHEYMSPNESVMERHDIDIAILGGGLAGGLAALALARMRPGLSLLLVEAGERPGGNHVWSFFESDVETHARWLTDPLVTARWDGYDVRFAGHSRHLSTPYRSITGESLAMRLRAALPADALLTGTAVREAGQASLTLEDGRRITAGGVIDARGAAGLPHMAGGWQKFAGQILRTAAPHGLSRPVVMDARVEQLDGYRFVYCLPFAEREVFVEDTYYSDDATLDLPLLRGRIAAYAAAQGWQVTDIAREETGVLPVVARGDFAAFWGSETHPARIGARAATLHPLTSYSLPFAVRTALAIAALPDLSGAALARASHDLARRHWQSTRFYRMLARMLFGASEPQERHLMLERFYRLPQDLIERFYAARSTGADKARVLAGRPPVRLGAALASLAGRGRPLTPLEPAR